MSRHALLSASAAHRWMNCPPSVRLTERMEDKGSEFAAEGTDAHALCEHLLKKALGWLTSDPTENLTHYNQEMQDAAEGYAAYVLELLEAVKAHCRDPAVMIEQRVDYSLWAKEGFGTADCLLIADTELNVIDFKYGQGVQVDADHNPQMMLYALGAMELFNALYDIESVTMTIYQPRKANISICTMPVEELYDWAEQELRPKAELAWNGSGEYSCGEWCRFCKAKATCRKRAEKNLELAKYDFAPGPQLDDEDIEEILGQVDELVSWASDIKAYALQRAVRGHEWQGYKLVEGRSNRRYTDASAAAEAVQAAGYDPYKKPEVLGITEMTRLLGKKRFSEVLGDLIEKPRGKPVLVPESDKRPPLNTAADDFREVND